MSGGQVMVEFNDCVNVSFWVKVGSKAKLFLSESNETIKIWVKIREEN